MRPSNLALSPDPQHPEDSPYVLSYFALRKTVGWIAILLPILTFSITCAFGCRSLDSISASYYTGLRNYFVGSLCAIGLFLIACLGYEEDRVPSVLAGCFAFVVAFCPTDPPQSCTASRTFCCPPEAVTWYFTGAHPLHVIAATSLFLTLTYFCLVLFRKTQGPPEERTPHKKTRDKVYAVCGWVMFTTMAIYALINLLHWAGPIKTIQPANLLFYVETICLLFFGFAWIVKGQQIFGDTADDEAFTAHLRRHKSEAGLRPQPARP